MSTPPPNLGYQRAQPDPPDRRTLRAQRQADKDQARLGRDQARRQMRALRRRSITGPILLVLVGILLLLLQLGRLHWSAVLTWLSFWWPAILIATGVLMVLEWLLDNRTFATAGVSAPRRTLGGAATTLLLLLAVAGAGVMIARRSTTLFHDVLNSPLFGRDRNNWAEVFGEHSDFTDEQTAPLSPEGKLTIDNPRGDVTVTGASQDGLVHVSVHQHLFTLEHDDLNARHSREEPKLRGDRENLTLSSAPEGQDDADLTIQLPRNASLVVRSGHGDVSVEELHGMATIAANGEIKLTALRGPVRVDTANDDSTITAHSLGGGLTLSGHGGDMDLSDIEGGVLLRGNFFGTTKLARISGNVSFQSSFTHLDCAGVPGSLVIEGRSDLNARHLQGPLNLATTDRDITLDGLRGSGTITDRNGSVKLVLAAPIQPLHITNTNGTIDVSVPEGQPFTLHAKAQDAEIHNDFNLASGQTGSTAVLNGQVLGGGAELELNTTNDDIRIHRSASANLRWSDNSYSSSSASGAGGSPGHTIHKR